MTPLAPHEFWQQLYPPGSLPRPPEGYDSLFPASLPDGREIALPIRPLPGGKGEAVASLILNQASFAVEAALVTALTERASPLRLDLVVGLPTLGLALAHDLAKALGHSRYVALGTSRKFWYDSALSEPLASITSPAEKRLYLDPRLLPLLDGRRLLLVDDVISTGRSMSAGLRLLAKAGAAPVALAVAMVQTRRSEAPLAEHTPRHAPLIAAIETPLLHRTASGRWLPA
ncbi:MAG TPA: phosphoribosyltransferase [Paracoccaceae bacterium]|nr:phosphoribosyltransferase [Paracoccaceae bacterium]